MNATQSELQESSTPAIVSRHRLGVLRLAATAGASGAIIFILCWAGTFIPFSSPTHAYIALFTPAEMQSAQALAEGTLWSFLFGVVVGGVFAVCYNLFAGLERR
jgi:hypothetical protein